MKKIFILVLILSISACERKLSYIVPTISGKPSGTIFNTKQISNENGEYVFETNLHIVDSKGDFISNLGKNSFSINDTLISGTTFKFEILDVEKNLKTKFLGTYNTGMLFDQSGSILSTDPNDLRIEAGKVFVDAMSGSEKVSISSFSTYYSNYLNTNINFTDNKQQLKDVLNSLANSENGGTPLYFSLFNLIDYVNKNSMETNKSIVVFTDGDDTEGGVTISNIIEKCNNNNISVYTVGLGKGIQRLGVLAQISAETGGAFMWAEDAPQLISYFGTLGNLLKGNAEYYKLRWKMKFDKSISNGRNFIFNQIVKLPNGRNVKIPVYVTIK